MRGLMAVAAIGLLAGCATAPGIRRDVVRTSVSFTVQLRSERDDGGRRAGSAVVIASDPGSRTSWVVTTRHFLEPPAEQRLTASAPGHGRLRARIVATSPDNDLALAEIDGVVLPAARLQERVRLGDTVLVVAYPWGRRATVVSGIVSQLTSTDDVVAVDGVPRMVDASVSYGSSGGGVFDAESGGLVGIVEGYRTARISVSSGPERVIDIPVPGETTVVAAGAIRAFLGSAGYGRLASE